MKRWQRRLFGILALGGGATGVSITAQHLLAAGRGINIPILLLIIAIYAWGMWCGLMLLEGRPGIERFNRRYWLVQIPIVSTPIVSGHLWGGTKVTAVLNFWPIDLNFSAAIGAGFEYSFAQRTNGVALGVNLFAFVIATWLQHIRHQERARVAETAAPAVPATVPSTETPGTGPQP